MTINALFVQSLFADAVIASDATHLQYGTGTTKTVRVVHYKQIETYTGYETTLLPEQDFIEVRKADLATVLVGDTFTLGSKSYVTAAEPTEVMSDLVWRVSVRCE